ncbi:MAG: sn-glycerol-3-phosphate ABC transporter ATP-binding protein UgpC [Betaproteobacteria bacterium]|nr:MAG: sn-glycerol-3-phosphate ABC transporter ATP-binding protein UgpC [Betaproteobacteria bacterium]
MAELSLRKLRKVYKGSADAVLHDIDLDVRDGEFMVFVGPSGCGKSTTRRLIAGLEEISSGDILIDGQSVAGAPAAERGIAMVFQSYALYPHMTVAENMAFSLKMAGESQQTIQSKVGKVAETLQLSSLLDRKPKTLSGGQRQRVAIGRAIVRTPKIFLFDEPLSNLDASLRVQMRLELSKLHKDLGTTMIYVTHDQVEAMTLGSRIAVFNAGRVEQIGTPLSLFHHPENQFVAGFLGAPKMNFIDCEPIARNAGGSTLRCGNGVVSVNFHVTQRCVLGVRPEDFAISTESVGFCVRIDVVEQLGDAVIAYATPVDTHTTIVIKLAPPASQLRINAMLWVHPRPGSAHVFTEAGAALTQLTDLSTERDADHAR